MPKSTKSRPFSKSIRYLFKPEKKCRVCKREIESGELCYWCKKKKGII